MKIRKTQPKNNKYYIRQATGGLNGAVTGYPTISGANVLCNCVGYANGRFNEIINDPDIQHICKPFKYQLVCNAENFIESAKRQGLKISATPIQGGIMVWQKGATLGGGDGAGHVAICEEVYDDGTILTSESGYGAWAFKTMRRNNTGGRWGQNAYYKFRGCIINPSVKDAKVVPAPKLSVDGIGGEATVTAMQKFFGTPADGIISGQVTPQKKFYPSLKAVKFNSGGSPCVKKLQKWLGVTQDGLIGQKTVRAWQKKLGVNVDGIFGSASMKAWQKYLNANKKAVYPTVKPTVKPTDDTIVDKELQACKEQLAWMKNAKYGWEKNPTIAKSKKKGTCVTYVSCVLQRLGILKSGQALWHSGKGYGTGKVTGVNDRMTVTYMGNKSLASLKSKLKAGDIVLLDDNKSGVKGSGGHIFILTGKWSGGDPYVYDQEPSRTCIKTQKPRKYSGKRKVLAIVRLKGNK